MCTIALAWQVLEDAPVAIAANRDEALDRESLPPRLLGDDPAVVAPQDAEAGGTWIGVSERGLVVAITNRWLDGEPGSDGGGSGSDGAGSGSDDGGSGTDDGGSVDAFGGERSRGLLVRDALARDDATDALAFVRETVAEYEYSGFNLLVVDDERATYLEWDGQLSERELEPGVHVIVNPGLNEADDRAVRLREALLLAEDDHEGETDDADADTGRPLAASAWLSRAAALLGDHDFEVCVHGDGFGTRSSSLLRVGPDGTAAYAFANGPPCETEYEPAAVDAAFLEGSF